MHKCFTVFTLPLIVLTAAMVSADIIDITLENHPAYISSELRSYLPFVNETNELRVGFDAANIGGGKGDGVNEEVAFSFVFQPITEIDNAYLTLDLTPHGTGSDELLFADNISVRGYGRTGAKFYGNTRLETLRSGVRTTITFDLQKMDFSTPGGSYLGIEDLSMYLMDGDLNVVYADDAIIHSARLRINTGFITLPPLFPQRPPSPPPIPPCNVPEADGHLLLLMGLLFVGGAMRKNTV
jgi:hypothetical protein